MDFWKLVATSFVRSVIIIILLLGILTHVKNKLVIVFIVVNVCVRNFNASLKNNIRAFC